MACAWCRGKVEQTKRGRPRRYCGRTCRQRAYEMRRLAREHPGRTRRAIGTLKARERAFRDARRAMTEAEIEVERFLLHTLAEWRRTDPERFEHALSRNFGSGDDLMRRWWAQKEAFEKAVRATPPRLQG
jgi:hypothetical protein